MTRIEKDAREFMKISAEYFGQPEWDHIRVELEFAGYDNDDIDEVIDVIKEEV